MARRLAYFQGGRDTIHRIETGVPHVLYGAEQLSCHSLNYGQGPHAAQNSAPRNKHFRVFLGSNSHPPNFDLNCVSNLNPPRPIHLVSASYSYPNMSQPQHAEAIALPDVIQAPPPSYDQASIATTAQGSGPAPTKEMPANLVQSEYETPIRPGSTRCSRR